MIIKSCKKCGFVLERLVFAPKKMFEEWQWNGTNWELLGHNSLIEDPQLEVHCPECNEIVGIGKDFGF